MDATDPSIHGPQGISHHSYAFIVDLIRQNLVRECSSAPYNGNYKDGHFASDIVSPTPLLDCLQILINSPKTDKKEKTFFDKLKKEVTLKLASEANREASTEQDICRMKDILFKLSTVVRLDCRKRLADRRLHPQKTSRDTVMDDKLTMIPEGLTYAVKEIHEFLVFACRKGSFWNYHGGLFSSDVVISRPVVSCLECIIDSPRIALAAQAKSIPVDEMLDVADFYCGYVKIAFEQDQKARFFTPDKSIWTTTPPNYKGKHDDIPSFLLAMAHQVLLIGVKETNYLSGKLKDNIAIKMDSLMGLSFLSTNDTVPTADQAVFEAAKIFVQQLKEYQKDGVMDLFPTGMLHLDFIEWFNPICVVFDVDATRRKHKVGKWPILAMTNGTTKLDKKDVVCGLGTYVGHPLLPDEDDHRVTSVPRNGGPRVGNRKGKGWSESKVMDTVFDMFQQTMQGLSVNG